MRISIAERLRPFCHLPGTYTLLPGSAWPVQIFPCLIRIYRFQDGIPLQLAEINLEVKGPVEQFTIFNDLEKGRLTVTGITCEGWMQLHLIASLDLKSVRLLVDRAPKGGLRIQEERKQVLLQNHEWLDIFEQPSLFTPYVPPHCDRLSLGSHKAQDWELIKRRDCLEEIFPLWHRLGQMVPQFQFPAVYAGTLSLLAECRRHINQGSPEDAQQSWRKFFLCGFTGMLVPQFEDDRYQGIIDASAMQEHDSSPLVILSEGARLIRQLFIQQEEGCISILPFLLPCFPFGRVLDVPLAGGGSMSIEWSKKTIRRMVLRSEQDTEFALKFRSDISSYRLRMNTREKGERRGRLSVLALKKNCCYYIDNFN